MRRCQKMTLRLTSPSFLAIAMHKKLFFVCLPQCPDSYVTLLTDVPPSAGWLTG